MTEDAELVYGLNLHATTFIVLPADVARDIAADNDALRAATTYGQARALQLTQVKAPGLDEEEDDADDDASRADDDPYDPHQTGAADNGDWPVSAATFALDYLPNDLDIGEEVSSFVQTPGLFIDPDSEDQLIEAAREAGYTLRRDDQLIARVDY